MSGDYSPKKSLLPWAADPAVAITGYLVPVLSGFTALALHGAFRYPANIPGHHGLEFMAILCGTLMLSGKNRSAYLFSLGAGIGIPVFGLANPLGYLAYILPGLIMGLSARPDRKPWLMPLLGGLAYASIPAFRILLNLVFGVPSGSLLKFGYAIPLANFFVFGLLGSMVAVSLFKAIKKK